MGFNSRFKGLMEIDILSCSLVNTSKSRAIQTRLKLPRCMLRMRSNTCKIRSFVGLIPIELESTRKYGDVCVRFGGETFGRTDPPFAPSLVYHILYAFINALESVLYLCWRKEAASSWKLFSKCHKLKLGKKWWTVRDLYPRTITLQLNAESPGI